MSVSDDEGVADEAWRDACERFADEAEEALVEGGPCTLEELVARVDGGAKADLVALGVEPDGLVAVLADHLLGEFAWQARSGRVVAMRVAHAGLGASHVVTAEEVASGRLDADGDLVLFDVLDPTDPAGRLGDLGGDPDRPLCQELDDRAAFLGGPPGWLDGIVAGDTIRVVEDGERIDLEVLDRSTIDAADVETLRSVLAGVIERCIRPLASEDAHGLFLDLMAEDHLLLRRPLPPFTEVLVELGLEERDGQWGRAGTAWRTPRERRVDDTKARRRGKGLSASVIRSLEVLDQVSSEVDVLVWRANDLTMGESSAERHQQVLAHAAAPGCASLERAAAALASSPLVAMEVLHEIVGLALTLPSAMARVALAIGADEQQPVLARARALVLGARLEPGPVTDAALHAVELAHDLAPTDPFVAHQLARYRFVQGDVAAAHRLLAVPGLDPGHLLDVVEDVTTAHARSQRVVGRNDPCPCGSGRKFKQCCQRSPQAGGTTGGALDRRAHAVFAKLSLALQDHQTAERTSGLLVYGVSMDEGEEAMRRHIAAMVGHPLLLDAALLAEEAVEPFLARWSPLLPADEATLLAAALDEPHDVWEVLGGSRLCSVTTGEASNVGGIPAGLRPGDLLFARVVREGEVAAVLGGWLQVPLRLRALALETVDLGAEPYELMDLLAASTAPSQGANREGEPLVGCRVRLATASDEADLHLLLDPVLEAEDDPEPGTGDAIWTQTFDLRGETIVRGSVVYRRGDGELEVLTNSVARRDRLVALVRARVPDATEVSSDAEPLGPFSRTDDMVAAIARYAPRRDDSDADRDEVDAMVAEYLRAAEERWVDAPIPALGGLTPRAALDDPTRREDLLRLLREFDDSPGAFDVDRLRELLGP